MGIRNRIRENRVSTMENLTEKLLREEREFRADRLVEKWSRMPEIGTGIEEMSTKSARNLAILLENQTRMMSRMTESAIASNFNGQTPENMLRLIRLSYPNSVRGELFTEFAMETANDSIKYILPTYQKKPGTKDKFDNGEFPVPYSTEIEGYADGTAMYENAESRYATELHNVPVVSGQTNQFNFAAYTGSDPNDHIGKYLGGDSVIYIVKGGVKTGVAALQNKDGSWVGATVTGDIVTVNYTLQSNESFLAIGRYDSEQDFDGNYLGEVELVMRTYKFQPRIISLGVTWTQLAELTLDTSFGVSAEEMMMDSAAQEIKKTLDYQAIKYAVACQKKLAKDNYVTFDADPATGTAGLKDSYWHTAQLTCQPIEQIANKQLDLINRGGVTAIVGGPKVVTYLKLNEKFSDAGAQPAIGAHKVGSINGVDLYKAPTAVIGDEKDLLTVWKNPTADGDVAMAIGTLLPFYSTGALQRKNLYKEGAIARFEDTQCLNPNYFGRITVNNIRG